MVEVVDDVIAALKSDNAVKALVGTKVYYIKPAAKQAYPFLTVIEAGNREVESADDEESVDEVTIQVDIWSKNTSFIEIKHAVQQCMRKLGYTHSCGPDDWIPEADIYHKSILFKSEIDV